MSWLLLDKDDPLNFSGLSDVFNVISLFANGEQGAWYDPSDLTTLFQDSDGIAPVTTDGQSVGLVLDKSQGLASGSEEVTNGENWTGATGTTPPNGWTAPGPLTQYSIVGGALSVESADTTGNNTRQTITTVVGKSYKFVINTIANSGNIVMEIGSASRSDTGTGIRSLFFTATSTSTEIGFRSTSVTNDITVDDASVKELKGNHAMQTVSASRPLYKTDSTLHWLQFDGTDDSIDILQNILTTSDVYWGINKTGAGNVVFLPERNTLEPFLGSAENGSSAIPDQDSGSPVYKSSGMPLLRTRQALYNAVTQAPALVLEANNAVAGSTWTDGVSFSGYSGNQFTGNLYSLIISETKSTSVRTSVRNYVAEKSGVTI